MYTPVHMLERWALYTPKAIAIRDLDSGRSFSYRELFERSLYLASQLRERHGIGRGDRVALLSNNTPETIFLFYALRRLGACLAPLNWRLTPRELQLQLADCEPKLFLYHWENESVAKQLETGAIKESFLDVNSVVGLAMDQALSELPRQEPLQAAMEDISLLLYTSGTTGAAKGAMLSNRMLLWNTFSTSLRLQITRQDKTVIFHPFFHTSGWNVLTMPFLQSGACVCLTRKFDAARVLRICEEEGITILFGVPTMMNMMAEVPQFNDVNLSSVRYAVVGGEPMPVPLIERWGQKGVPVRQGFGLTEFGPNCFSLNEEDAIRKRGSIGFPNHFVETRIIKEGGEAAATNEVGELQLRGPAMMSGYWKNPQASETAMADGWLHTGDLVRCDEEGYFFVVGRKKDMFISGAENVYPAEVEQFLATHPAVREVAVIGVADERWGEVGKAFISFKPGQSVSEAGLKFFCEGNLAKYKIPKHFQFLADLPKSDSGKIFKRGLV